MKGIVSNIVPRGGPSSWLSFVTPNSGSGLARTKELPISFYLSSELANPPSHPITFLLLQDSHTIMETRWYPPGDDELCRGTTCLENFYWFLNVLDDDARGTYRVMATMPGKRDTLSAPFHINFLSELYCIITNPKSHFQKSDTLYVHYHTTRRAGISNPTLTIVPTSTSGEHRRISVPLTEMRGVQLAAISLADLEGEYYLELWADVLRPDGSTPPRRTAHSHRFFVLSEETTASEPEPLLTSYSPSDGYRFPLDINVPVSWRVVYGWQPGDKIICRLMKGERQLYQVIRFEPNGLIGMLYNRRVSPEAEGDYQVVIEHRRGGQMPKIA